MHKLWFTIQCVFLAFLVMIVISWAGLTAFEIVSPYLPKSIYTNTLGDYEPIAKSWLAISGTFSIFVSIFYFMKCSRANVAMHIASLNKLFLVTPIGFAVFAIAGWYLFKKNYVPCGEDCSNERLSAVLNCAMIGIMLPLVWWLRSVRKIESARNN